MTSLHAEDGWFSAGVVFFFVTAEIKSLYHRNREEERIFGQGGGTKRNINAMER